jgi:(hydroxyamino)benzene mutase
MDRRLLQLGFLLLLLAFLTGLAVPALHVPRLGLSAHVAGLLGGVLLLVLGSVAPRLALGPRAGVLHRASWVYATYAHWLACLLGAVSGASGLTPLAGAGQRGSPAAEHVVAVLLVSLSVAALLATGLALWGLRAPAAGPARPDLGESWAPLPRASRPHHTPAG